MSDQNRILDLKDGIFFLFETSFIDDKPHTKTRRLDLKEAVHYIKFATSKALRVLDKALMRFYELPEKMSLPKYFDTHQIEGIKWILSRSRSYLAHAPGAGKTLQVIYASIFSGVEQKNPTQILFIVPPSLIENWRFEIRKWTQNQDSALVIGIIPESADKFLMNWDSDIIICPDSMLTREWVLENLQKLKFNFVAVDEASRFKESTSQRTIALFGGKLKNGLISKGLIHGARHAVLMDGSPMPNRPMELWAPTYAMCPQAIDFFNQTEFGFKYCGAKLNNFHRWEFKYSSNEAELKQKLQKEFMHVVSESELSHPERRRTIIRLNGRLKPEFFEWEKQHLSRFRFDDIGENLSRGVLSTYRRDLGLSKVPLIANYVKERLETKKESIILFCWHLAVIWKLRAALSAHSPGIIHGGVCDKDRQNIFEDFQNGRCKLIIGNIAAMGRGLNLQRAERVIFGEFSWSNESNLQAEKRAARKGNECEFVKCDYLVFPDSLDEIILNAIFRKGETVGKVIG